MTTEGGRSFVAPVRPVVPERLRAERRNVAPEALTKHHLATANNNEDNNNNYNNSNDNKTTESPKAKEEPNFVSGLIKRLSDQTTFELVCR